MYAQCCGSSLIDFIAPSSLQEKLQQYKRKPHSKLEIPRRKSRSSSVPPESGSLEPSPCQSNSSQQSPPSTSRLDTPASAQDFISPAPLPPLSHHQLLTLHNLHLPRPAFFSSSSHSARYMSARTSSRPSPSALSITNLYVPLLIPPITRTTLQELDLGQILRNPQLRHDIVFAPVSFLL